MAMMTGLKTRRRGSAMVARNRRARKRRGLTSVRAASKAFGFKCRL
jgi:hypothetical protein